MPQHVERIDYAEPPPNYKIWISMHNSGWALDGVRVADDISSAWAHYKARHNPPGMWSGFYGRLPDLKIYTPRMGLERGMELMVPESEHATPELAQAAGREAAWVHYDRWLVDGKWFDAQEVDCG